MMKGTDVTEKQMRAAEQFIQLVRPEGRKTMPHTDQWLAIKWEDLVRLVAHYGAIRAGSIAQGESVDEPGEVFKPGKATA